MPLRPTEPQSAACANSIDMRHAVSVALLGLVAAAAIDVTAAQECEAKLPDLPETFTANVQYNLRFIDREEEEDGFRQNPLNFTDIGISLSVIESVAPGRAFVEILSQAVVIPTEGGDVRFTPVVMKEAVLWNNFSHAGVKKYLHTYDLGWPAGALQCKADELNSNSKFYYLFGMGSEGVNGIPSVAHMLHMSDIQECVAEGQWVKGVLCNEFRGSWDNAELESHFEVTYYWSDPKLWFSSLGYGRSMPVLANLTGSLRFPGTGQVVFVDMMIDFALFLEQPLAEETFLPPRDLACSGTTPTHNLTDVLTSSYFHYNSEVIFHWSSGDHQGERREMNVILHREEWYDYDMQVARTDYMPFNHYDINDPLGGNTGYVKDVKDFTTGVLYSINREFGNCSVMHIGQDFSGDVIIDGDNIHMSSPFDYWHLDALYTFNGAYPERGIGMDYYVSVNTETNHTTVLAFTDGRFTVQVGKERKVPVKMERYPNGLYNDPKSRVVYNIIGFDDAEPALDVYDVSACFPSEGLAHRKMRITITQDMNVDGSMHAIRAGIRNQAAIGAAVNPIRIQNIEVNRDGDNALNVILTVIDRPPIDVPGGSQDSLRELDEAVSNLKKHIDDGKFVISIPDMDGNPLEATAKKGSFASTDRNSGSGKKYSPGAMAGLAIGMIILTVAVCGAVYMFVLRN